MPRSITGDPWGGSFSAWLVKMGRTSSDACLYIAPTLYHMLFSAELSRVIREFTADTEQMPWKALQPLQIQSCHQSQENVLRDFLILTTVHSMQAQSQICAGQHGQVFHCMQEDRSYAPDSTRALEGIIGNTR